MAACTFFSQSLSSHGMDPVRPKLVLEFSEILEEQEKFLAENNLTKVEKAGVQKNKIKPGHEVDIKKFQSVEQPGRSAFSFFTGGFPKVFKAFLSLEEDDDKNSSVFKRNLKRFGSKIFNRSDPKIENPPSDNLSGPETIKQKDVTVKGSCVHSLIHLNESHEKGNNECIYFNLDGSLNTEARGAYNHQNSGEDNLRISFEQLLLFMISSYKPQVLHSCTILKNIFLKLSQKDQKYIEFNIIQHLISRNVFSNIPRLLTDSLIQIRNTTIEALSYLILDKNDLIFRDALFIGFGFDDYYIHLKNSISVCCKSKFSNSLFFKEKKFNLSKALLSCGIIPALLYSCVKNENIYINSIIYKILIEFCYISTSARRSMFDYHTFLNYLLQTLMLSDIEYLNRVFFEYQSYEVTDVFELMTIDGWKLLYLMLLGNHHLFSKNLIDPTIIYYFCANYNNFWLYSSTSHINWPLLVILKILKSHHENSTKIRVLELISSSPHLQDKFFPLFFIFYTNTIPEVEKISNIIKSSEMTNCAELLSKNLACLPVILKMATSESSDIYFTKNFFENDYLNSFLQSLINSYTIPIFHSYEPHPLKRIHHHFEFVNKPPFHDYINKSCWIILLLENIHLFNLSLHHLETLAKIKCENVGPTYPSYSQLERWLFLQIYIHKIKTTDRSENFNNMLLNSLSLIFSTSIDDAISSKLIIQLLQRISEITNLKLSTMDITFHNIRFLVQNKHIIFKYTKLNGFCSKFLKPKILFFPLLDLEKNLLDETIIYSDDKYQDPDIKLISSCLSFNLWIRRISLTHVNHFKSFIPVEREFLHISNIFLKHNCYTDPNISALLRSYLDHFVIEIAQKRLNLCKLPKSFSKLFPEILNEYFSSSYFLPIFQEYLQLFLIKQVSSSLGQLLWDSCLRFNSSFTLTPSSLPFDPHFYIDDELCEKSLGRKLLITATLTINNYKDSILANILRWNLKKYPEFSIDSINEIDQSLKDFLES